MTTPRCYKENLDRYWTRSDYTTANFLELRRKYNFLPVSEAVVGLEAQGFTVHVRRKCDASRFEDAIFRNHHLTLFVRDDDNVVMNITEG